MRLRSKRCRGRQGFTLVELLVVITIIMILAAMLLAAGFKVYGQRKIVQARTEMTQLSAAVDSFKRQFKVDYLPSRIHLSETCNYNLAINPSTGQPVNQLDFDSVQFLKRMFPLMDLTPGNQYDWNGDGVIEAGPATKPQPNGEYVLEGDQCLVFFLGGIPSVPNPNGGCQGFSTNPRAPTFLAVVGGTPIVNNPANGTIRPFYDFNATAARLQSSYTTPGVSHPASAALPGPPIFPPGNYEATSFYSFVDPWGSQPYLYFSSYKTANSYNRYVGLLGQGDCPSAGVWPYAQLQGTSWSFYRPESYQIVSAGPDHAFGSGSNPGTVPITNASWTPLNAGAFYPTGNPGNDDLSNFYSGSLGTAGAQ
jgi:general secretion pathway protein G